MYKLNFLALSFLVSGCGAAPRLQPEAAKEEMIEVEEEMVPAADETETTKGAGSYIKATSIAEFDKIIAENKLVIVDFYAEWCVPCKQFGPIFEQVAAQFPSIVFVKVDGEKSPELLKREGIRGYPTIKVYKDGKHVGNYGGNRSKKDFSSYVSGLTA